MPKFFKIIALVVSALVLLVAAAMTAVLVLVDPNNYKDEITGAVHQATGRTLTLGGDITLSIYPWIGLSLGDASLSNAEGFGAQPMASVSVVDIKVKLLPLLARHVEMDSVRLRGLRVNLQRAEDGRSNWQDLFAAPPSVPSGTPAHKTSAGLPALAIGGVELLDAHLEWDDQRSGRRLVADRLNLRTSALATPQPMDVSLSADVTLTRPSLKSHIDFVTRVTADLARQQVDLDHLQLQVAGLSLDGDLHAAGLGGTPSISAQVNLASFSPRTLAAALNITLPKTADATVLNKAAANMHVEAAANSLVISQLSVTLDNSTLSGNASLSQFEQPSLRFDLTLDALDADRYLPAPAAPATATTSPETQAATPPPPAPIPSALAVDGRLGIGKLKLEKARLSDIQLHLLSANQQLRLHPVSAALYGGNFKGDFTLDARTVTPKLSLDASLSDIQAGPLLEDLFGNDALLGSANAHANLNAHGSDVNDLLKTLGGTARINFENGAMKGVNLGQLLREAYAKLKKLPAPSKTTKQTDFAALSASAVIRNGVVTNRDLKAAAPALRVTGAGKVDLPQQRIDYRLTTTLLDDPDLGDAAALKGLAVPIKISGTFDKPAFAPDLKTLLKAKAKEELAHNKKKPNKGVEKKLEQKIKNKLKELF